MKPSSFDIETNTRYCAAIASGIAYLYRQLQNSSASPILKAMQEEFKNNLDNSLSSLIIITSSEYTQVFFH